MVQDQKGIAIGNSRKDYSGRINANFSMMDEFVEIKTHAEYREANRDKRSTGTDPKGDIFYQSLKLNPTDTPYDPNSPSGYNVMTGGWEYYNPVADINLREDNGKDKWMLADATLKLNFTQELSAQATLGYQGAQWQQNKYVSAQHKASLDNSRRGEGFHRFWRKDEVIFEAQANCLKEMGDHQVSRVADYSFFETNEEDFEMTNYDFPVDGIGQWDMEKGTWLSDGRANMKSNKKPCHRLMAFLARANYSFRDTYIATASIRREGSSKFGKDHRWGTFYSLSGGWRISNEAFMEDISFINDLKFRVGYGVTGNNGFEANNATKMYSSDSWWIINGDWDYTYGSAHNVNYDLHWEEKTELNFGVDYSVLNNRLFCKFDVYKRKVNGMIYEISVPMPPAIHDKTTMNAGNLQNKGWEFEIGGVPVKNKNFQYMTTMRFSHNTSKITSL